LKFLPVAYALLTISSGDVKSMVMITFETRTEFE
jgi:hypothetical protein